MTALTLNAPPPKPRSQAKNTLPPDALIYEVLDGQPIYYRHYQDVLANRKTKEEVMATGRLQTRIIGAVQRQLYKHPASDDLEILSNEVGIHVAHGRNFSCDLVAFDKKALAATPDDRNYYTIPPKFIIEVDTNGDFETLDFSAYMDKKSQRLLEFGVEKMIWILTASKTVLVKTAANEPFITRSWSESIEIFDGSPLVLDSLFSENGIKI